MHLYIHVPFCARRCSYCDFAIAVRRETPDAEYADRILTEWRHRKGAIEGGDPHELQTLYFGGGTPSRLEPQTIEALISTVTNECQTAAVPTEITLETNPDDVTVERAEGWRAAGVNRISLGVQSHHPNVLDWMHRTHTADQVAPAMAMLRGAGFENISVDLIFALPSELERDWDRDFELTLMLKPDHISLYGLTVEPHTPLARWTERGTAHPAKDDRYEREFLKASSFLANSGYVHYEVSNAALPGKRSRHNSAYWSGAEYLGLGPSAHSLLAGERSWNEREWVAWSRRIAAEGTAEAGNEKLSEDQKRLERVYLGLRTDMGLPSEEILAESSESWIREGWAELSGGQIRLTPQGWLRLDALVTRVTALVF